MAVLIYTENWGGKFKKLTFELVSYASAIAQQKGTEVIAFTIGDVAEDQLKELGKYGASKVLVAKDAGLEKFTTKTYSKAISAAAKSVDADVVIFANNISGVALAPRVSIQLDGGLAAGALALPSSVEPFVVRKRAYSGKAFADMEISAAVKVVTLNQNSYKVEENQKDIAVEDFAFSADAADMNVVPTEVQQAGGKMSVTDAEILISGGRGLKGPENWGLVEEMADILGAGTCCSRPVSDLDWRPHSEHVGQTGKVVAPNLYIAIGISGAIQHLAGVNGSKVIVAINNDDEAPFFEAADYGIVGDAFEVVPKLNEALRKFKSGN